jgi:hypothetical protein
MVCRNVPLLRKLEGQLSRRCRVVIGALAVNLVSNSTVGSLADSSKLPESAGLNLVEACHGYRTKGELEDELIQFMH